MRDLPSIWVPASEAAEIMGIPVRELYEQVRSGQIAKGDIKPRTSKNARLFIRRAALIGEPNNILPFGRTIDMDELADKLMARMIANPVFAKAMADVAMRPLFDQLMKAG